jgi:hypothetical protein
LTEKGLSSIRFPSLASSFQLRASSSNRVFKNKHRAVSQGAWRFGKRSILAHM